MNKQNSIELRLSEDGSHTLYLPSIDETYHSIYGAINESMHIFIQEGFDICTKDNVRVLEVGFGTGLNAYLAALGSRKRRFVQYTTYEKFPLNKDTWSALNYHTIIRDDEALFKQIHLAAWETTVQLMPTFSIRKIQADFSLLSLSGQYDVIFFDAFSPDKQAELWTEEIFSRLYEHTANGGILTTYCAKGVVRRAMQAAGYVVARIPGPKGKREILRAIKYNN